MRRVLPIALTAALVGGLVGAVVGLALGDGGSANAASPSQVVSPQRISVDLPAPLEERTCRRIGSV